jgi:hypothetical protein
MFNSWKRWPFITGDCLIQVTHLYEKFRNVQFTLSKDQISLSVPYSLPSTFNICYEWQPFNKHSLPREEHKSSFQTTLVILPKITYNFQTFHRFFVIHKVLKNTILLHTKNYIQFPNILQVLYDSQSPKKYNSAL